MTSVASSSPPPPMLDLDASPIAGQTGWAVLDLQGNVLKSNSLSAVDTDAPILFQMLQQSATIHKNTVEGDAVAGGGGGEEKQNKTSAPLTRMTVTFPGVARFLVTRDETHIYLVQTRVE